jgi:hypothetical protein
VKLVGPNPGPYTGFGDIKNFQRHIQVSGPFERREQMVSPRWRGIWNCPTQREPLLKLECPQCWEGLTDTGDPAVRHCHACLRAVHLCRTPEDFVRAAEQGHCVAIPRELWAVGLTAHQVGQPSEEAVAAFKAELRRLIDWWDSVIERMPEALGCDLHSMRERVDRRRQDAQQGAAPDRPHD